MKIITLNVNGIRSAFKKGFFDWLKGQNADVVCLQEVRANEKQLNPNFYPEGFHSFYHSAKRKGYSGVAVFSRSKPDKIQLSPWQDIDDEGRYLEVIFSDLHIISLYLPSGSSKQVRQNYKMDFLKKHLMSHLKILNTSRERYIICGDFNIAHKKIDLKNWRSNQKNSGFLPEERAWLDTLFFEVGYIDGFRSVNKSADEYTWWSNRGNAYENNTGWRIDYQVLSKNLANSATSAHIYKDKRFSDHAPLVMDYHIIH